MTGLGTGLVIGGFGSGALFFTPAINALCMKFSQLPTYLGSSVELVMQEGRQFAQLGGQLQEVVYATASDLSKLPYEGLAEGYYVVSLTIFLYKYLEPEPEHHFHTLSFLILPW